MEGKFFPENGKLEPSAQEKPKGFYKPDQEVIEKGRKNDKYQNDPGFRTAIDTKALINEVTRMSSLSAEYFNDSDITGLISDIEQFEEKNKIKTNGVVVRLRDILETKNKSERKQIANELITYLSGIDVAMDMIIDKINEKN